MTSLNLSDRESIELYYKVNQKIIRISENRKETYCYSARSFLKFSNDIKLTIKDTLRGFFSTDIYSFSTKLALKALLKKISEEFDTKERLILLDELNQIWSESKITVKKRKSKINKVTEPPVLKYLRYKEISEVCITLKNTPVESINKNSDINKNIKLSLIMRTLFLTGIRISELIEIKLDEIEESKKRTSITINGRNKIKREVFISKKLFSEIKSAFNGSEYLFESNRKTKLNRVNLYKDITNILNSFGYIGIHPHSLRHSSAMYLLHELKWDAGLVASYLGYSNISNMMKSYFNTKVDENIDSIVDSDIL